MHTFFFHFFKCIAHFKICNTSKTEDVVKKKTNLKIEPNLTSILKEVMFLFNNIKKKKYQFTISPLVFGAKGVKIGLWGIKWVNIWRLYVFLFFQLGRSQHWVSTQMRLPQPLLEVVPCLLVGPLENQSPLSPGPGNTTPGFVFSSPKLKTQVNLSADCLVSIVPPSVHLSVNFLYFHLILKNHWANFNHTLHKASLGDGDSCLFKWRAMPFCKGR